jgi:hypothetical protein
MDRAILTDVSEHDGRTYAEPLSGLRVSWGSILAGALALVAVSTLLWALAAAIILTATNATVHSIKGCLLALWICGMVTTLAGGIVGGWLAGFLPGNRNVLMGAVHGFLAWGLAFVVMSATYFSVIGGVTKTALMTSMTAAASGLETAGSTVGGAAGGNLALDAKAQNLLTSLGYTSSEARSIVADAKSGIQRTIRGHERGEAGPNVGTAARETADTIVDLSAGLAWSWFGTWLLAAALAVLGGIVSVRQLRPGARASTPTPRPAVTEPQPA